MVKVAKISFTKCIINEDGSYTIPKEFVDRWTRQMNTKYIDLSEQEKILIKKRQLNFKLYKKE